MPKSALRKLASDHLDTNISNGQRLTALAYIEREAHGHPKTAVMLAKNIERGTLHELQLRLRAAKAITQSHFCGWFWYWLLRC